MKQKSLSLLLPVAAASLLGACATHETSPQNSSEKRFAVADKNHDGKLSRAECREYLITTVFEARDRNHDHKLTAGEWVVEGVKGSQTRFADADANKDGAVTLAEAFAYGEHHHLYDKYFHEADKNKDGYVTLDEARAYYASKEDHAR